jgi:hypothetical protein
MAEFTCPCCGSPMAVRPPVEALAAAKLSPIARAVVDELVDHWPRTTSLADLANKVYADRVDGGPLNACNSISVIMHRARAELARHGWRFGPRAPYLHSVGLWPLEGK